MLELAISLTALIIVFVFIISNYFKPATDNNENNSQGSGSFILNFGKAFLWNVAILFVYGFMALQALFGSGIGDDGLFVFTDILAFFHGIIALWVAFKYFKKNNRGTGMGYLIFGILILVSAIFGGLLLLWASRITHFQ